MNWYKATNLPLSFAGAISETYVGAAIVEAPIPIPPKNRKMEKKIGSLAKAVPMEETKNNIPMIIKVFFLPKIFVGKDPKIAPITVPHNADDITTNP